MTRAVLTFHDIDDSGSVLSFPVAKFAHLIEELARSDVPVVTFSELLQRDRGITIAFDDGMRSVHRNALPVLREHRFPAHLFLATGLVGKEVGWTSHGGGAMKFEMLDWDEVEECARCGIRMECHTVNHPDLRTLSAPQMLDECSFADQEIERHVGRRPTLLAFPFGLHDQTVCDTLASRYQACFTTHLGYLGDAKDRSRTPRLDTYYLQKPFWYEHILAPSTRSYLALRSLVRTVRGKQSNS
jgi:peptidoglycan/xylan/chitin deacetylase (PgdA/CDA1 family)